MSELDFYTRFNLFAPYNWVRTPLCHWGLIISGGTPSRNVPGFWSGEYPWVTPGEITKLSGKYISSTLETISRAGLEASAAFPLPENSVLVTSRATIGAVAINTVPMSTNQGFKAIVPHPGTDTQYLYYVIKLITPELVRRASGSTFLEISKKDFELVYAPQPPLPEQRRIAAILDTLDLTIEATQRIISKLQATRQGLLHDLLTRGLDEHGKLRDMQLYPEQFKDTALGRMPVGWEVGPLADQALPGTPHIKTGPFGSALKGEHWTEEGVPVITIGSLGEGRFLLEELLFVSTKTSTRLSAYLVRSGQLVFSRVADVGRSAVVSDSEEGWLMSSNLMRLALDKRRVNPYYFHATLVHSVAMRAQMRQAVNGGGREVANTGILEQLKFAWPTLEEQNRITAIVNAHDKRLSAEQAQLAKLQTLKRGLMEDLLTGRVRVAGAVRGFEDMDADTAVQPVVAELPSSGPPSMPPPLPAAPQHRAMYRAGAGAHPEAMSEWTRQLWDTAQRQQVGPYSHAALDAVLPQLAAASVERAGVERIPELLAGAGVRFVLLPHSKGSKASGAAFYLDDGRTQPVVGLSLRYPLLDVFWFNLFHELGHIRLGHEPVLEEALDSDSHDPKSPDEQAADAFARQTLIPEAVWQPFLKSAQYSSNRIKRLARGLTRHPATVAGRLAFDTQDWRRFNTPELRPNIEHELRALMAKLGAMRGPLEP